METLSWILLAISVLLLIILLKILWGKSKEEDEKREYFEISINYIDGKKESILDVENYELDEFDDFVSIYLKGEDPIFIKTNEIRRIHVK